MNALALPTIETFINNVWHYDALTFLRSLPAGSVNCCVTSPPYYGLRDYGADGQIGLEDTPERFVARLVELFEAVRSVLRDDGVLWLNLGDTYAASRGYQVPETKDLSRVKRNNNQSFNHMGMRVPSGLKPKDLIGIPWRVAFALQSAGWWLRNDIVWAKPNPMPESVSDRCTVSHEYVFLLTKSARYWMDMDAIREPLKQSSLDRINQKTFDQQSGGDKDYKHGVNKNRSMRQTLENFARDPKGRNRRTVWTIPTEPKPFQHFAMFPQALIEPMILAGCPGQACAECGAPYVRDVSFGDPVRSGGKGGNSSDSATGAMDRGGNGQWDKGHMPMSRPRTTLGFSPSCECGASYRPGVVLDPFMGSGTSALVAQRLGRHFTGCDLNPEYVKLARQRIQYHGDDKRMVKEQAAGVQQLDMFV